MTAARRPADNPFRVDRVLRLRYRIELAALRGGFQALGFRAALVGPHGSGKSTLREDLLRHLEHAGWATRTLQLHADEPAPARCVWHDLRAFQRSGDRHLIAIDGAELIPAWRWTLLSRRCSGPLLITSTRPGRLATLHQHATDPDLLHSLVAELVGESAAATLRRNCDALYTQHHGNLRDCLRSLYDEWQAGRI